MISFKKEIYKKISIGSGIISGPPKASITEIDAQSEEGVGGCVSCATLTVEVPVGQTKQVVVTLSGPGNGQYNTVSPCTNLGTLVGADLTEEITTTKTYRIGIDAFKNGTDSSSNTITFNVFNFDGSQGAFEVGYILTRAHSNILC